MYAKTMLPYTTLVGVLITTSGCLHLPPYRMKRKKVVITQPTAIPQKSSHQKEQSYEPLKHEIDSLENNMLTHIDVQEIQPTITIWIHGTRLMPSPIFSTYVHSEPGLHPIRRLDDTYHLRQLANAMIEADPVRYPLDHLYAFGWSGKLSADVRKQAAQQLHTELLQLVTTYEKEQNVKPRIRIITHSHGGNIALHLPDMRDSEHALEIEELILLACPVQEKTMHNIEHPMFKKTYALYSSLDMLQILAPQFMYRIERKNKKNRAAYKMPIFSSRRFLPHPKLAQIKVKINGHSVFHTTFSSAAFTRMLPTIIDEIDKWQREEKQYPFDKLDTRRLMSIYT